MDDCILFLLYYTPWNDLFMKVKVECKYNLKTIITFHCKEDLFQLSVQPKIYFGC